MTDRVIVRSSSVEAAKALLRRNAARGKGTDAATSKLASARYVGRTAAEDENDGSSTAS